METFLRQTMGLDLPTEAVATLKRRTEGWVAGLQAVALSLEGQVDVFSFIEAFSGRHPFVLDYLVEEVLKQQPEPIRHFLLQTSSVWISAAELDPFGITVQEADANSGDLVAYVLLNLPDTVGEFAALDWSSISNELRFPPQVDLDADGLVNTAVGGADTDDYNADRDGDGLSDLYPGGVCLRPVAAS